MSSPILLRGSIRRRLIIQLLVGAALLAALMFLVVQRYARDLAGQSQDEILAASVTAILDSASVRQGELTVDIPYFAFSMLGNISEDRVFYAIRRNGSFLTGYPDLPKPFAASGSTPRFQTDTYDGEDIRMATATRRLSVEGQPDFIEVTVAQTRYGLRQQLAAISQTVAGFGIGFFVLSALFGILAAQSAIRPLRHLAESVSRRGLADLRPVSAPVPAEMEALVRALNGFMSRLKTSLTRSEDLIAEAAHRVRTPLATVRTQAEITLRRVDKPENRQAVREMIRAIDESSRAAGQLLDHAMVSFRSDHLELEDVEIARLVRETVDRVHPTADLRDIDLVLRLPEATMRVKGDTILMQSALLNLLDNAIKYSPADSCVHVSARITAQEAVITVRDEGAGFPKADMGRLTRRFVRGSNTDAVVGSGLGLTIAHEVARAHGGRLFLTNHNEEGGACASLSFPLA